MGTQTTNKKKEDRLSRYFKDLNDSDIDSDDTDDECAKEAADNDEEQKVSTTDLTTPPSTKNQKTAIQKLPSASECLGTRNSPAFLKLDNKKEIDWDNSHNHKNLLEVSDQILDFKPNAVPPPTSYEPVTDPGIKVVDSDGKKRKSLADDLEDQMSSTKAYKVERLPEPETEES